jgi:hypothetical protein
LWRWCWPEGVNVSGPDKALADEGQQHGIFGFVTP